MKRVVSLLSLLLLLCVPAALRAQQSETAAPARAATVIPAQRSEWLGSFSGISVNGMMLVHLVRNAVEEGPRIVYDTKGEPSPRFRAAVDRNGILKIEEPADPKRTTVTEVTVYCNDIATLSVAGADLTFENTIQRRMFDLEVSGGANVKARFDVSDLAVEATGRSSIVVEGTARYLHLNISTAKFDGAALSTVSSIVDASHASEVRIDVGERLEAVTSTSARILYTGDPMIVRSRTIMFGGDISPVEQ